MVVQQALQDHQSLQKCYFLFLNSLATNNVTEVIAKGNVLYRSSEFSVYLWDTALNNIQGTFTSVPTLIMH